MAGSVSNNCTSSDDELKKFRRFLCYGTESSACRPQVSKDYKLDDHAPALKGLIESSRGEEAVKEIVCASTTEPSHAAIFSLAACARVAKDLKAKQAAYAALPKVCQSPTDLFLFVNYAEQLSGTTSGWGRAQRKAISAWYNEKDPTQLAVDVTKYKSRFGWSHLDLLRLAHVKASKEATALILKYVNKGFEEIKKQYAEDGLPSDQKAIYTYLEAVHEVKHSKDEHQVARLVEQHRLSKEHIPTALSNSKEVWRALLHHISLDAILSQLGKLTTMGLLDSSSKDNHMKIVLDRLNNENDVVESKLEPVDFLLALKTYEQGKKERGKMKWMPSTAINEALMAAYYHSFKNVISCGVRYLIAVDINGTTPGSGVLRSPQVKPLLATAAMAMLVARSETQYQLVGYSQTIAPARLSAQMPMAEVVHSLTEVTRKVAAPTTDCALPILWAIENNKAVDVFVIFTDCEGLTGPVPPIDALRKYRKDMKIPDARLVVCALNGTNFKMADTTDFGMLDIIGCDATTPHVIRKFAAGHL